MHLSSILLDICSEYCWVVGYENPRAGKELGAAIGEEGDGSWKGEKVKERRCYPRHR